MSEDTPAFTAIDPASFEFGIVTASYNKTLCDALQSRVCEVLNFTGVPRKSSWRGFLVLMSFQQH